MVLFRSDRRQEIVFSIVIHRAKPSSFESLPTFDIAMTDDRNLACTYTFFSNIAYLHSSKVFEQMHSFSFTRQQWEQLKRVMKTPALPFTPPCCRPLTLIGYKLTGAIFKQTSKACQISTGCLFLVGKTKSHGSFKLFVGYYSCWLDCSS